MPDDTVKLSRPMPAPEAAQSARGAAERVSLAGIALPSRGSLPVPARGRSLAGDVSPGRALTDEGEGEGKRNEAAPAPGMYRHVPATDGPMRF